MDISCPRCPGMTVLDRSKFQRTIPVLATRVPVNKVGDFKSAKEMKSTIVTLPNIRNVQPDPEDPDSKRLVLLNSPSEEALQPAAREYIATNGLGFTQSEIRLDYTYWGLSEILEAILPREVAVEGIPSSFTHTGHIAHFNLREQHLPYKHIIGEIVLDKNKTVRTVVNKVDTIDTKFRVFKMEVMAGDPDFNVVLHESECTFEFDFSTVYWNSRLQYEHDRLIQQFKPGEVIADVFAGVGPFAVPAARKGCFVLGNDLNPASSSAMQNNANINKVQERLRVSCKDGREFIRSSISEIWNNPIPYSETLKASKQRDKERRRAREGGQPEPAPYMPPPPRRRVDHFVMNLPATAVEFLDAFKGVFTDLRNQDATVFDEVYGETMPWVHCHAFSKGPTSAEGEQDVRKRAEQALGGPLGVDGEDVKYHLVRDVAPNKQMYCISFRLPKDIALLSAPSPP